ncbi:MAG TPA: hypothetical protein VH309_04525, partial [Elusimicrobiota bacterium]|nr:hypothetical protein [Elusimicrobiota bacterium]
MLRLRAAAGAALAAALAAAPAAAQIDPARRFRIEGGYEQGVGQPGPTSPYLYAYVNRPGVLDSSDTLRLVVAPVYADAELGIHDAFGPYADAGLGLSGGGWAFGQTEIDRGDEKRGESFAGHGGGPSFSAYPRLGRLGPAPLNANLRIAAAYADYVRDSATAPQFALPQNGWTGQFRAGLRWGGLPPGLDRAPAMEVSAWWESLSREHPGPYGYGGDRVAQGRTDLYWTRLLFQYATDAGTRLGAGASLGAGTGVDRFSAYRLGGMLTLNTEFPLVLPGYFSQEIAAQDYAHLWLRAGVPLDDDKRLVLNFFAAAATITPIPGTDAGGAQHAGVGTGIEFA